MAGVSEQSVRQWVRAAILRPEVTPLGALFSPEEVGALIASREAAQRERAAGRPRHIPAAAAEGGARESDDAGRSTNRKEGTSNG